MFIAEIVVVSTTCLHYHILLWKQSKYCEQFLHFSSILWVNEPKHDKYKLLKSISVRWEQCKLQVHCFCSNIIIQMETFISCVEIFLMLLQDFKQSAFNLSLYLLLLNAATQPAWIMLNKIPLSLGIYHAKSRSDKYDSQHKQIFSNWPKSASEDDL